jgi:glycosyltransferase 2 family protein
VRSFGNGAGLLVQQQVAGRSLTELDGEGLGQAQLGDLWRQVAGLRAARIAHRDLGLASVMVDEDGQVWLVDFDRAEAAASQALLDRDLATLQAALEGVADPALVRATAEQALGQDAVGRMLPRASTERGPTRVTPAPEPALGAGPQLEQRDDRSPR